MKTFALRQNFVLKSIDQPLKTKSQESEMVSNFQEYGLSADYCVFFLFKYFLR